MERREAREGRKKRLRRREDMPEKKKGEERERQMRRDNMERGRGREASHTGRSRGVLLVQMNPLKATIAIERGRGGGIK